MAEVTNNDIPNDPEATKLCKKCGRRFPTSEFVSARGLPTLLCRICRKSSNDSVCSLRSGGAGVALYLANLFTLPGSTVVRGRVSLLYVLFLLVYLEKGL